MSAKTTIPGYSGYIPNYQTEYPMNKLIPAHKYEDIEPEDQRLEPKGRWTTNYQQTIEPKIIWQQRRQDVPVDNNLVNNFNNINTRRSELQAKRDVHEYETRPASNWGTTYGMQYNGWKMDRQSRSRHARARTAESSGNAGNSDYRQPEVAQRSVLQGVDHKSSYGRSFGPRGGNPRSHYVPSDGKAVFSRRATTNDLFAGSNKGSVRIPGYAGYVPDSRNNINIIRNNMPPDLKNNLLEIYRHQMPGYTGRIKEFSTA